MVPELHPPSPAKKFFTKMAKSLFGKKKSKGEQPQQQDCEVASESTASPLTVEFTFSYVDLVSLVFSFAVEKIPCEEKEDKDISKLVSGIVKCSINRQISYKTVGPNEVRVLVVFVHLSLFTADLKDWLG